MKIAMTKEEAGFYARDGYIIRKALLGAEGAVLSTEEILARAWDDAVDPFTNTVRMTISRLRAKLGEPGVIETVTPVGYRIPEATPS